MGELKGRGWAWGMGIREEDPAEARGLVKVGTGQPVWPEFPALGPTATKGFPTEPGHTPLPTEKLLSLPRPPPDSLPGKDTLRQR